MQRMHELRRLQRPNRGTCRHVLDEDYSKKERYQSILTSQDWTTYIPEINRQGTKFVCCVASDSLFSTYAKTAKMVDSGRALAEMVVRREHRRLDLLS